MIQEMRGGGVVMGVTGMEGTKTDLLRGTGEVDEVIITDGNKSFRSVGIKRVFTGGCK